MDDKTSNDETATATPLHEHTPETMMELLRDLGPALGIELDGQTVTARLDGIALYIRAKSEKIFGPGLGWSFDIMGPSEWHESDPDESVKRFCVTRVEQVRQVVDWLASKAWAQHREAASS